MIATPTGSSPSDTGTAHSFTIRVGLPSVSPASRSSVKWKTREIGPGVVVSSKAMPSPSAFSP